MTALAPMFEPTTGSLYEDFVEARDAYRDGSGQRSRYRTAFERWFRAACADGRPPDSLSTSYETPLEKIEALTLHGAEHDYWTGPMNQSRYPSMAWNDTSIVVRRYLYEHEHGVTADRYKQVVGVTCGEEKCVRRDHLLLIDRDRERLYSDAAIAGSIQTIAIRLGHPPSMREYEAARTKPSIHTITNRFGGWTQALRFAGVGERDYSRYTVEDCLAAVRRVAAELGHTPTLDEYDAFDGVPSRGAIRNRFGGSWVAALTAAGLDAPTAPKRHITRELVLEAIRERARELGRPPRYKEWGRNKWWPAHKSIKRRGWDFAELVEEALS